VWDVTAGVTTRRLAGHMGKVHAVELNADATVLASGKMTIPVDVCMAVFIMLNIGSYDATVRLWDLR